MTTHPFEYASLTELSRLSYLCTYEQQGDLSPQTKNISDACLSLFVEGRACVERFSRNSRTQPRVNLNEKKKFTILFINRTRIAINVCAVHA